VREAVLRLFPKPVALFELIKEVIRKEMRFRSEYDEPHRKG